MRRQIVSWFRAHRRLRVAIPSIIVMVLLLTTIVPIYADWSLTYPDVRGTYNVVSGARPLELDGSRHPRVQFDSLIITSQTYKVLDDITLEPLGADIDMGGLVGPGRRPSISLSGTDSDGTYAAINGRVKLDRNGDVTAINGRLMVCVESDGERGTDSVDGTSAISAAAYHSQPLSTLLTAGTLDSPEYVLFHSPFSRLTLHDLTSLREGRISFWFNLQEDEGPGPQMMLRFEPRGNTTRTYYGGGTSGLVDITIMPYQGYTGTGAWVKCSITKDTKSVGYYGNDPTDYTPFGLFEGGHALLEIEALINAEDEMKDGGDNASDWVLTMVSVELWEGGARTCYVDDVTIDRQTYTMEPNSYYVNFKAVKIKQD